MQIIYSIILFLFGLQSPLVHDFHFTKGMLKYQPEEKAWQLSLHVYIDDFEKSMNLEGMDSIYLCTKKENPNAEMYIQQYLDKHFQLEVDGQNIGLVLLGKEVAEDIIGMWIYAEAVNMPKPAEVVLKNHLINNLYDDQKNMMSIQVGEQEEYVLFDIKKTSKSLSF